MVKRLSVILGAWAVPTVALAGGGIGYSATDPDGTVEKVVETRALPGGMLGAIVSYTRQDNTRSFVEYAVQCEPMAYAYLGMVHDDPSRVPNPRMVHVESDRILENDMRPLALVPLNGREFDGAVQSLAKSVCS